MEMLLQDRNKRRALIVRRWSAYRIGQAQREVWRKRRGGGPSPSDELDESAVGTDLLDELPESLLG